MREREESGRERQIDREMRGGERENKQKQESMHCSQLCNITPTHNHPDINHKQIDKLYRQ